MMLILCINIVYRPICLKKFLFYQKYNASYTLLHKILTTLDNKHVVGGIFCDLTKNLIA